MTFFIAEIDNGFIILELPAGAEPADIAAENAGTVVDAGPYATYEEAADALLELEEDSYPSDKV